MRDKYKSVNILYIADPNSIHDLRWINFLAEKKNIKCFVIARYPHFQKFLTEKSRFNSDVIVLAPIRDPSTIRPWRNWYEAAKIRTLIKKHHIAILHILYAEPNSLWVRWKSFFKVPVVITTHGTDILKTIPYFFHAPGMFNYIIAKQYRRALNRASHITCTSFLQIENMKKIQASCPITLVRTGVDFSMINRAIGKLSNIPVIEKPFVLMPRSMKPIYYHDFTLDAIRLMSDQIRAEYAFVFINSVDEEDPYYNGICDRVRLIDADIRFISFLPHQELLVLYRQASLIVMNPKSDGSPVTAMEAMACGRPVVLPPLQYDQVIFGGAWFFEDWSPRSLTKEIETLLRMDATELSDRLEKNYQTILANGDFEKEMRKIEEIYKSLIQ